MRTFLLCVSALLCAAPGAAQQHHHHPSRPDCDGFPLIPRMGDLHHPVSTTNPTAQKYFDQGLTLVYGFNYDGAFCSFQEASRLDPTLAMAHWGMALALGANINVDIDAPRMIEAAKHVDEARRLAGKATQRERDYVEALAPRYSHTPDKVDWKQLAIAYSHAMKGLWNEYWVDEVKAGRPPDPDAAVLYAESLMDQHPWHLWDQDGKPCPWTPEILDVLTKVRQHPETREHVGAVHYRLHVLEPSPSWRDAEPEAEMLRELVPGSGHLVHMPSHIYLLQEEYARAAERNEKAIGIDRKYRAEVADDGYVGHYLSHNLHFYAVALALDKREQDALKAARETITFVAEAVRKEPGLEHYLSTEFLVLARFGKWDDLRKPGPPSHLRLTHAMWQWGRAVSAAETGDLADARGFLGQFSSEAAAIEPSFPWGNNTARGVLAIAELDARSRIAKAEGKAAEAARLLAEAAAAEKALYYDEPPPWVLVSKGRYLDVAPAPASGEGGWCTPRADAVH